MVEVRIVAASDLPTALRDFGRALLRYAVEPRFSSL
jgi:hypothetical protein